MSDRTIPLSVLTSVGYSLLFISLPYLPSPLMISPLDIKDILHLIQHHEWTSGDTQSISHWNRQTSPVWAVDYSEHKVSYKPWVDSASLSKWLFALVMLISTKISIMITMSNPPLQFVCFFVYRLALERTGAYSIRTTWLTFNVCVNKFYIILTSLSHVLFWMSTSCLYTCYKPYLIWLYPLQRVDPIILISLFYVM
jgi:hypothetical protein